MAQSDEHESVKEIKVLIVLDVQRLESHKNMYIHVQCMCSTYTVTYTMCKCTVLSPSPCEKEACYSVFLKSRT